ncbi:MAG: molybdopterin-dependent oxidoreductase [Candidatus Bathyarchaeia archaeon]|jgi:DMSO/TMAO reductase YedYZ molybdopterin-dependent catalytic subunit
MKSFSQYKKLIIGLLLVCVLAVSVFAFYWFSTLPKPLLPSEVQEYQSEDLSAINDFRENSIHGPQYINKTTYTLNVTGLVDNPTVYTYDQVLNRQKYEKVVTLHCVEGWSVKILWEGILLEDLFNDVGVQPEAKVVILYAVDGYSTSFPLDYIANNSILLAYKMNGVEIPPERGFPFMLVAESQYGYKWIKWITRIELSDNVNYLGYWELRGYPNDASLR